jgi:hypothetical protein
LLAKFNVTLGVRSQETVLARRRNPWNGVPDAKEIPERHKHTWLVLILPEYFQEYLAWKHYCAAVYWGRPAPTKGYR